MKMQTYEKYAIAAILIGLLAMAYLDNKEFELTRNTHTETQNDRNENR